MNKTKLILLFILIFLNFLSFAQLNIGGLPKSFTEENKSVIFSEVKFVKLPNVDLEILKKEDIVNDIKGEAPWRFGKLFQTDISPENSGTWEILPNGDKIWRVGIESENALSINMVFDKYFLPENAVLYIYSVDKKEIIGGFTSDNNQSDSLFATGIITSCKVIVEYFEPKNVSFQGKIKIGKVTHGYRGINDFTKALGDAGSCNMNVACDDGTYADQIRSVCMLVSGNDGFCTGALINNVKEDGTPYLLTANHCYSNPSTVVFMFNWESSTCENPVVSPPHNDISGASLISKNYDSDFCLYKLFNTPPFLYNVYYSGWNANDISSVKSVGIHHPQGDIKKISYDDNPSVSDYYLSSDGIANSHWKVVWDRNTTTEPGSSGSPLFDQNGRIIGQLHGGYASCNDLTGEDYYGKFSTSWNYGSTPETRLKDWLDPENTGTMTIPGFDPNIIVADNDVQILEIISPSIFIVESVPVKPIFKIRNMGYNLLTSFIIKYYFDTELIDTKTITTSLASYETLEVEFPEKTFSAGNHTISVYVENPNGVSDENTKNDMISAGYNVYSSIFFDDFETDKLWKLTNEFEIGEPLGLGGINGFSDPLTAISGIYILGTDISGLGLYPGDYEKDIKEGDQYAESSVIDCRYFTSTKLAFKRYLNVQEFYADNASIQILTNEQWVDIWKNGYDKILENEWSQQYIDISDYADGKRIKLKFNLASTNGNNQYSGWNIDDFRVMGDFQSHIYDSIPKKNILLYPNPAKGYFDIEINKIPLQNFNVLVSDISGKTVFLKDFNLSEIISFQNNFENRSVIRIEMKNTFGGIYFVKINIDGEEYSDKIVLSKNK